MKISKNTNFVRCNLLLLYCIIIFVTSCIIALQGPILNDLKILRDFSGGSCVFNKTEIIFLEKRKNRTNFQNLHQKKKKCSINKWGYPT